MMDLFQAWVSSPKEIYLTTLVSAWDEIDGALDLDDEPDHEITECVNKIEKLLNEIRDIQKSRDQMGD